MQVCVLGAGIIGLTTAFYLSERGYDVMIVDRHPSVSAETSHRNGCQLSYSYVAPLANPSILKKIPSFILGRDAAVRFRPPPTLAFLRWAFEFVRRCNSDHVRRTTIAQLALACVSKVELERLASTLGMRFAFSQPGKLVIYRSGAALCEAQRQVDLQRILGVVQQVLSAKECLNTEPALRIRQSELAGGIFTPSEQVGDCAKFSADLFSRLRRLPNVKWALRTRVLGSVISNGDLRAIRTDQGTLEADRFVVCLGASSGDFCRRAGFWAPIYPVKGYSLTVRPKDGAEMLQRSVTDAEAKIVMAPLRDTAEGKAVRVAGIADFVGYAGALDPVRIAPLRRLVNELLDVSLEGELHAWTGLRPTTPDSRPIIGWSPVKNLLLNTGHGALGWTLACGSARLVSELLAHVTPCVTPEWFSLHRQS